MRTELKPAAAQVDSQLCPQGREAGEGARQRSGAFEQPRVRRLHRDDGGGQDCEAGRQQSDATQVVHNHSGVVPIPSFSEEVNFEQQFIIFLLLFIIIHYNNMTRNPCYQHHVIK